jgi:hypothetical protein
MTSRPCARAVSTAALVFLGLACLFAPASATTYLIRPDGTGDFPTIQEAIGAASDGDVIQLADGTYLGDGNSQIMFQGKAITVESQSDNPAVCGLSAVLFVSGEGRGSVLRGIRVVWDYSTSANVVCWGASPTFDNCSFEDCLDSGGVYVNPGAPLLRNCRFSGNSFAMWIEGATDPILEDCTFINNQRGIYGSRASVTRCWFENNNGGAVKVQGGTMSFTDCTFVGNHAGSGGAVYVSESSGCHLTRCTFYGNSADMGSAVLSTNQTDVTLDNCIVASNTGSAPVACHPLGHQNVPVLACCDLYGNQAGDWTDCILGQLALRGNLTSNPLFCDPVNNVFTLRTDSPCAAQNSPLCGQIGAWEAACEVPAAVEAVHGTPSSFALSRALPNPFTATTSIVYSIPVSLDAPLSLRIHDAQGRLVRELANGPVTTGPHVAFWDGCDQQGRPVAAGTYFYRIEWNGQRAGGTLSRIR